MVMRVPPRYSDFYPRPPRGGRHVQTRTHSSHDNFYPRPPRGGRPLAQQKNPHLMRISIHALREEGDSFNWRPVHVSGVFLSTPSARRATYVTKKLYGNDKFLSTPSARRATHGGRNCRLHG